MKNVNEGLDIFDVMFNTTKARNAEIAALGQDQELHELIKRLETEAGLESVKEAVHFLLKLEASRR